MTFTCRLADVNVRISALHPAVYSFCAGYETDGPAAFEVEAGQAGIDRERARAKHPGLSDASLEILAVCRGIAERMPLHGAFLFHGSAVASDGEAYIFAAPSGTGKSTHARLWREMPGSRAVMINDDKPLIRVDPDGAATACGSPWTGQHRLGAPIAVPLRAICLLERGEENRIVRLSRSEALPAMLRQAYRPADPAATAATVAMLTRMRADFWRLACNMDPSAAAVSLRAMKGG